MARERGLYRRKDSRFWWIGLVLPDGRRVCTGRKRSRKCYVGATVDALMLGKFLINWCARRDSNSRPPGS